MKKVLVLITVLTILFCYSSSVYAVNTKGTDAASGDGSSTAVTTTGTTDSTRSTDIKGCAKALPGVSIDVRLANVVHTIIVVIEIAVPVVLVIFGMMDLFKSVTAQKEEEIKKGRQILIKRLISAVIVFFVIAIVRIIVSFAAGKDGSENIMSCANCFINGASADGTCK